MLNLRNFVEEGRNFASPPTIRSIASERKDREKFSDSGILLIFDASKQRTWMVASDRALYCVIDKLSEDGPRVRWRIPKDQIVSGEGIILSIRAEVKSDSTGTLYVNDKRPRLFSRHLFTDIPIERRIKHMILKEFNVPL